MSSSSPRYDEPVNPYAPPDAPLEPDPVVVTDDLARAEAIRRAHLDHEANLVSVGQLHLLAAILCVVGIVGIWSQAPGRIEGVLILSPLIAANGALGYGLVRLQTWARWTEATLIGLLLAFLAYTFLFNSLAPPDATYSMLIGFAASSFIPAVVLGMLLSRKGTVVFSTEYRAIIERTPHVRYRTSCVAVVLALLIILFLLIGFVGLLSRR